MTQLSTSTSYQKYLAEAEVDKRLFEEEMQSSLLMFVYALLAGGALCAGVMCLVMGMQLGWSPLLGLILLGGVFPPLALQLFDHTNRFNSSLQKQRQRSINRFRQ